MVPHQYCRAQEKHVLQILCVWTVPLLNPAGLPEAFEWIRNMDQLFYFLWNLSSLQRTAKQFMDSHWRMVFCLLYFLALLSNPVLRLALSDISAISAMTSMRRKFLKFTKIVLCPRTCSVSVGISFSERNCKMIVFMKKFSSANSFQVFPSFIYTFVQCTLSYLLCSPPKRSPLHYSGRESSKQDALLRWLDSENFKSTAMVRNSSGYARTIYHTLWPLGSFWALNHSYLVCQRYCADRPSSKIILFCLQIPLIQVHF